MADAILTRLLNTGLRVAELVSLTWQDVTPQPSSGEHPSGAARVTKHASSR
jgi:integrase